MDILAHTLWTTAGVRKSKEISLKKGKTIKLNMIWTAFWGIFPDLFAFTVPFLFSFYNVVFLGEKFGSFSTRHQVADGFNMAHGLYNYSHSLIIWAGVFLLFWIIIKRPPLPLLGWLLHILIDIPSHSIAFFPTPFLFPISEYHFKYGVSWSNKYFMIINYSLLLVVWGSVLFKKNKLNK